MRTEIYIDNQIVDLFEDENIEITSSIADVEDITKNTTEFSKAFTVPASDNNNRLFRHYYNADVDNTFDARVKVTGRIDLRGAIFKVGNFTLRSVRVRNGKPRSYKINFVGNLINLRDKLGNDKIADLPLSQFDHDYNSANVLQGMNPVTGNLFNRAVVYSLLSTRQFYYNSDVADKGNFEKLTNIAWNGAEGDNGINYKDLTPSLGILNIIAAIEQKYSLIFSRDFFGRQVFKKLYILMSGAEKIGGDSQYIDFDGGDNANVNFQNDTGTFYAANTSASNDKVTWDIGLKITPQPGFENTPYTMIIEVDEQDRIKQKITGNGSIITRLENAGEKTYLLKCKVISDTQFEYTATFRQERYSTRNDEPSFQFFTTTASLSAISSLLKISENLPDMQIIDFLKGLFKAFKLVVIPTGANSLYINNINDYYAQGETLDISDYIDFSSYDVSRGNLLKKIEFKFSENDTILNAQFKKNTGIAYGDEIAKLTDNNGKPLDGDSKTIELPFENMLFERLRDLSDKSQTSIGYGAMINDTLEPEKPEIMLHYTLGISIVNNALKFIGDQGEKVNVPGTVTAPSAKTGNTRLADAFLFGSEFDYYTGEKTENNLYSTYNLPYIESLFNIKRRNFNYTAYLPLVTLLRLKLNDVLKIKGSYFRIDNYDTNLLTGKTSFKLFNSFDKTVKSVEQTAIELNGDGLNDVFSVYTPYSHEVTLNDTGDGVGFVNVSQEGANITFTLTDNTTGQERNANAIIRRTSNNKQKIAFITQLSQ